MNTFRNSSIWSVHPPSGWCNHVLWGKCGCCPARNLCAFSFLLCFLSSRAERPDREKLPIQESQQISGKIHLHFKHCHSQTVVFFPLIQMWHVHALRCALGQFSHLRKKHQTRSFRVRKLQHCVSSGCFLLTLEPTDDALETTSI